MRHLLGLTLLGLLTTGLTLAGDKKGTVVDLGGLKSTTPADWKMEKPSNKLRIYQFAVPGEDKNAELAIFYFDGGGGALEANVQRWKSKFIAPKGKTLDDVSKLDKFKVGKVEVAYLDVSGTYLDRPPGKPDGEATRRPNYRFFGIYFNHDNGPHFITLTGPEAVLEKHKKAFDEWLKNFK